MAPAEAGPGRLSPRRPVVAAQKLPAPSLSGRCSVFGTHVNQHTTSFRSANAACRHLQMFFPANGASGPPA